MANMHRRFGGSYFLDIQSRRVSQTINCLLHAGFMLGLLFHPADLGSEFLRNVDEFVLACKAFYPIAVTTSNPTRDIREAAGVRSPQIVANGSVRF
jgi:hypothetical protein